MRAPGLLVWIGVPCMAFAQQPTVPANGDIFLSESPGMADSPQAAFQNLYRLAAEITANPSSGYQQARADQSDWPAATAVQKRWFQSMAASGNSLTQQQRQQLVPCAAHLNAAIDEMERGYRIQITQKGNAAAQQTVQKLYAKGRADFATCSGAAPPGSIGDIFQSRGSRMPGGSPGGSPSGTPGDIFQSGGSTPGGTPTGTPNGTPGDIFQSGGQPANGGDPRNNNPSPQNPTQDNCHCINPETQATLDSVRQETQALQAEVDSLHNDFISGALSVFTGFLSQSARPHGAPSRDIWNAVAAYFTNNNAANHDSLRKAAVAALQAVGTRPLYYAGMFLVPANVRGRVPPSCAVGLCDTTALRASTFVTDVSTTKVAAMELKAIASAGLTFGSMPKPRCGPFPPGFMVEELNPSTVLNPTNLDNVCFPAALAKDANLKGLVNAAGNHYTVTDILPGPLAVNTPAAVLRAKLRMFYTDGPGYGGALPKRLSPGRLRLQSEGYPSLMRNKQAVEAQLRNRGVGTREIIVVKHAPDLATGATGHVFFGENSVLHGIQYTDPLSGTDASHWFDTAEKIWAFAVK